ncbi:MAG: hypothetical protein ACP5U0_09895 [Caldisphaera sp.]
MANNKFEEQVEGFYNYLINEKSEHLRLFSTLEIQIEGWFRGELMRYFEKNLEEKEIKLTTENREVPISEGSRKKVDLKIPVDNMNYWIELKHILVGYQKNDPYPMNFYFHKNTFIANDVDKLLKVDDPGKKNNLYSLIFISTNYLREDDKASNMEEIRSEIDLKNQFTDMNNYSIIKDNIFPLSCWDYNDALHFGFLLLRVKNDMGKVS